MAAQLGVGEYIWYDTGDDQFQGRDASYTIIRKDSQLNLCKSGEIFNLYRQLELISLFLW